MKKAFKKMGIFLLILSLSMNIVGCGGLFGSKSEQLEQLMKEVEGTSEQDNTTEEKDEGAGGAVAPLKADTTYEGIADEVVSEDLIAWLCATYAIQTDANDLDPLYIGGIDSNESDISWIREGLQAGWGITDKNSAFEVVTKLVADDGDPQDDGWDYSRAEELLAQAYCVGWIGIDEYLEYAVPIGRMIQNRFSSWDEFGDNYLTGYMTWISDGGFGYAGDINERSAAHQLFVTDAEYYSGPYVVDFDMGLKADAVASYYDTMDSKKIIPGLDKIPEYVYAYIKPVELGKKLTSGTVEIDGDLYHIPMTVKAFLDNDWTINEECKEIALSWNKDEEITLSRNGKELTFSANTFEKCSSAVENGYIDHFTIDDSTTVDFVFPGGISTSSRKEDVIAAIEFGNAGEYKDGTQLEISLGSVNDIRTTSKLTFSFGGSNSITCRCVQENIESQVRLQAYERLQQNIGKANERKIYFDQKFGNSTGKTMSAPDDLNSFEFVLGDKTFKAHQTLKELTDNGWVIDDKDYSDDVVVQPGDYVSYTLSYKGIDGAGALWGFHNETDHPVKITEAEMNNLHVHNYLWRISDTLPFIIAKDISLENSTYDDLIKAYGELRATDRDKVERNGTTLTIYEYEVDAGTMRFYIYDDDKTVGDIMFMYGWHGN